jgi:dihydroorotase
MQNYLFKDISIVNEGSIYVADVLVKKERIEKIAKAISTKDRVTELLGEGKFLLPGIIDDQVHFREPGLTHKGDIYTEAKAAVAGGVTSFMEMPNTIPNTLTRDLLAEKYHIASKSSLANYSFFMGASNTNIEEVLQVNKLKKDVCGIKIFLGSSTGNMLVDNEYTLDRIFAESELLIATHCEDEIIIRNNYEHLKSQKHVLHAADHPIIRNEEACYASSSAAIARAKKYGSRLHILHISTAKETKLFSNTVPLSQKRITAEACVHHLHFTADDYDALGYMIKCNPAIKSPEHKKVLWEALLDDRLDIIATDHAPHTSAEKMPPYEHAHSGLPLVQHSLSIMLKYYKEGFISLEKIVEKMCHAVAECFKIKDRGYIREGYYADLVMLDPAFSTTVTPETILYKCGWSPFEQEVFPFAITHTFVSGNCVFEQGKFNENVFGQRLQFNL